MDYSRVYEDFIADRRLHEASLDVFDKHHVIPRCLGGGNEPGNLIRLSYGDHLFAHILLAKVHGGLLAVSANRMAGMTKYRGRRSRERYAHLRAAARSAMRAAKLGKPLAPEHAARIGAAHRGRVLSAEHRELISSGAKRRWSDPEQRARLAEIMRGNQRGLDPSPSVRLRISEASRTRVRRPHSDETKQKLREAALRRYANAQ